MTIVPYHESVRLSDGVGESQDAAQVDADDESRVEAGNL